MIFYSIDSNSAILNMVPYVSACSETVGKTGAHIRLLFVCQPKNL